MWRRTYICRLPPQHTDSNIFWGNYRMLQMSYKPHSHKSAICSFRVPAFLSLPLLLYSVSSFVCVFTKGVTVKESPTLGYSYDIRYQQLCHVWALQQWTVLHSHYLPSLRDFPRHISQNTFHQPQDSHVLSTTYSLCVCRRKSATETLNIPTLEKLPVNKKNVSVCFVV